MSDKSDSLPEIKSVPRYARICPDDWQGNNAVFTCPLCKRPFLVSAMKNVHNKKRACPRCIGEVQCVGICTSSAKEGGHAFAYLKPTGEKK